jgi:hypothetical protein
MLSGDSRATAERVAGEVGIDEVIAEVLPADKAAKVAELGTGADLGTQLQRKRSQIASYCLACVLIKNLLFTRDFGPVREVSSQD